VTTDEEISRTTLDGAFTWGGWEAPPVELDGELVYVGLDDATVAVAWRTGEVTTTALDGSTAPAVAGGHVVRSSRRSVDVVDLASGEVVFSTPPDGYPYVTLSPDGRFAKVVQQDERESSGFVVVDLRTSEMTTIDQAPWDFGWTPAGNLISVDLAARELTTCSPTTGTCDSTPVSGPVTGELKLAGNAYES